MLKIITYIEDFINRFKSSHKWMFWAILTLFILSLMPLLYIARYNHPSADDYHFASAPAHVWQATGSIIQTVKVSFEYMKEYYAYIQGTFVAVFFMGLQPLVFGENFYMVGSFLLIIGLAASTLFFLKVVLIDFFKTDIYTGGIIALAFTLISIQFIISPVEAFYWYTGSMFYILFHSAALVMFSLILLSQKTQKQSKTIICTVISSILAFLIGGGNFITALTATLILGLILVYRIALCRSKWIIPLVCFIFICISFTISAVSPGNDFRQQFFGERMDPLMAVLSSFRYSSLFITTHISAPVWIAFGCIATVIHRAVKNSGYSFRYPGIVTAILYGVYSSTFVPNLYTGASYGPLRVLNINYLSFLFFLLFSILYWCGWISRIMNNKVPANENLKAVKSVVHEVLVLCLIIGCFMSVSLSFNTISGISAMRSIMTGEAAKYHSEHIRRREIVRDPRFPNVALNALTFQPYTIFFDDITPFTTHGANVAMAGFYGKESIRLMDHLSPYHIGDTVNFGSSYDEFDSPRRYFVFGLEHWSGFDYTWSNDNAALFRAGLDTPVDSDLQLDLTVSIYQHNNEYVGQTIRLYVDSAYVDEVFLLGGGNDIFHSITFNIPKELVSERNFLEFFLEFPDAYHPIEIWDDSTDEDLRAIGFRYILLTEHP